jgi:hypothetical protein
MRRDVEELLLSAPLRSPSEQLARRVALALNETEATGGCWYTRAVPLWACVAAALACAVVGYAARGTSKPPAVVYVLPADGALGRVLSGEADQQPEDFLRGLKVEVVSGRVHNVSTHPVGGGKR